MLRTPPRRPVRTSADRGGRGRTCYAPTWMLRKLGRNVDVSAAGKTARAMRRGSRSARRTVTVGPLGGFLREEMHDAQGPALNGTCWSDPKMRAPR